MPLLSQVHLKVSDWVGKVSISHEEITSFYFFFPLRDNISKYGFSICCHLSLGNKGEMFVGLMGRRSLDTGKINK